jgi:hypothetical protein
VWDEEWCEGRYLKRSIFERKERGPECHSESISRQVFREVDVGVIVYFARDRCRVCV